MSARNRTRLNVVAVSQLTSAIKTRELQTLLLLIALLLPSSAAYCHFLLNLNTRIVHVEHRKDESPFGLDIYMRVPMPYLVANQPGPLRPDGNSPFTRSVDVDGELQHFLDIDALHTNPLALGALAVDGHHWTRGDEKLRARIVAVRVYSLREEPSFASLSDAKRSFTSAQRLFDPAPFVGDCVVDLLLKIDSKRPLKSYQFYSSLNPGLDGQENTVNVVLDYYGDDVAVFQDSGLLDEPLYISRSVWRAMTTFAGRGWQHILGGLDHVLFVVCLVIGAVSPVALTWRVTGFTIGHSVTLTLGFFGFVPAGAWFVPTVELLIASSIVAAAFYALTRPADTAGGVFTDSGMFATTVLLGLLHGLGFSFVLHDILKVSSPNLWQSLLAFNIGVEAGQLFIVCLLWPLLLIVRRVSLAAEHVFIWLLGAACLFIGAMWAGERMMLVLDEFWPKAFA